MIDRVVITGGAGFIGSHIVDKLVNEGINEIRVIDNLSSGNLENLKSHINKEYFKFIKYDLKKYGEDLIQALRDTDIVFHFAANPEVRVSSINPRIHFDENILATFNVLEASRIADVDIHVFASSSTVYGEANVIPTPEGYHPLEPISVYGAAKLACEILYITYSKLYGFKPLILRYANIIGPRSNHGVIIDFIKKLNKNSSKLEILGDGTQRKSYLHVYDAVDATLYTLKHFLSHGKTYEIYNIGNDDWITVKEIADIVVRVLGLQNVKYEYVLTTPDGRGWPGDVKFMLLDISKLKNIGWKPSMTSYEAVEETARYIVEKGII